MKKKAKYGIADLIYDTLLKNHGFVIDDFRNGFITKGCRNGHVTVAFGKDLYFGIILYSHNYFPDILIEKLVEIIQAFEKSKFLHHVIPLDRSQEDLLIGGEINIESIDYLHVIFENYKKLFVEGTKIADLDDETFAVTRLHPKYTGLPVFIWTDSCDFFAYRYKLSPRIKFLPGKSHDLTYYDTVPMSVSDNPEILDNTVIDLSIAEIEQIKRFVKNNKDLLLGYSNGDIDIPDFFNAIKKVEDTKNE